MVNIWDYANELPRIKLKTKAGKKYIGKIIHIADAEESDDVSDSLVLELANGEIRSFYPDIIESINVIK
jgi:hypothetical protein